MDTGGMVGGVHFIDKNRKSAVRAVRPCGSKCVMKKQLQRIEIEVGTYKILKDLAARDNLTLDSVICQLLGFTVQPRKPFGEPKYPFHSLEVGQSVAIPWLVPAGVEGVRENGKISAAVHKHAKRTGKRFRCTGTWKELTVTRLA